MSANPEISVIVTAYNHGKYIGEAIQSVLNQTFQDFEIIIIDDGSPDNTREVVTAIRDDRIRYIYQKNSGLPASARNTGMALSKGRYIALLDGDDFWHKDKLEKSKRVLDEKNDVGLVCHNEAIMYEGKILRFTEYGPYEENMYERLLFKGNCLHASAVTIRRELFFDDNYRFSEDKGLFTIEDYEYWMRLAKKYRFHFLDEVMTYVRVTESGAFLSNGEANMTNMLRLLDSHFEAIGPVSAELRRRMRIRKSAVMCAAGRMHHHKNNFGEARNWYSRAVLEYPFNYKAFIGFMAALAKFRIIYK